VISRCDNPDFDLTIIDDLKNSIAENNIRYAVPQKRRRIIFACNLKGAHARDIFKEPTIGATYTRIFMRSIDSKVLDLNVR
jgi:hypothetical protein